MSESFEYLRFISLGQYLPLDTPIHRRDPRVKVLGGMVIILAVVFTSRIPGLILALLSALLVLRFVRVSWKYALQNLLLPLPFLLILALFQTLWVSYREEGGWVWQWGWIHVSQAGVMAGGMLGTRFVVLLLWLLLGSYCISNTEMVWALRRLLIPLRRIGVPARDVAMAIQIALRFIPYLAQILERIAKAQASRGAIWGSRHGGLIIRVRQLYPILIPLFLLTLRKAEVLALAMEARGYSNPTAENPRGGRLMTIKDWLFVLAAMGLASGILLL